MIYLLLEFTVLSVLNLIITLNDGNHIYGLDIVSPSRYRVIQTF